MTKTLFKGKTIKLGDNISTDHIIPGRFAYLRSDLPQLAQHVLEDTLPDFNSRGKEGDVVVGGNNFGLGSSREHAPVVIKMAGISVILVKSVARIFFRNAINQGMPVLFCDTDKISDSDELEIDVSEGKVTDITNGVVLNTSKMPPLMSIIVGEGGLIPYIKKHHDFVL